MPKKKKKGNKPLKKTKKKKGNEENEGKKTGTTKRAEFEEFVRFMALPYVIREKEYGFKTQGEFAKKYNLSPDTPTEWKKREEFEDKRKATIKRWFKDRTPNVIQGIYGKARRDGSAPEAKLWLQYIEEWTEKSEVEHKADALNRLLDEISNANKNFIKPESADPRRGNILPGPSEENKGQGVEDK